MWDHVGRKHCYQFNACINNLRMNLLKFLLLGSQTTFTGFTWQLNQKKKFYKSNLASKNSMGRICFRCQKSLNLKFPTGNHISHVVTALEESRRFCWGRGYLSPYLEAERLKPLTDIYKSQLRTRTESTVACQKQQSKYCRYVRGWA